MLARARRTPSPPPNAGDSARVSPPRDAECAAATPTLGEEGEEEEEEEGGGGNECDSYEFYHKNSRQHELSRFTQERRQGIRGEGEKLLS